MNGSGGPAAFTNTFVYTNRLQVCRMAASSTGAVPTSCMNSWGNILDLSYDFHWGSSDNGNVYGITNYRDQSRNQSFTYDTLNRLISAQNSGTDCTAKVLQNKTKYWGNSYSYDAWGNLLGKSVTKCGAENLAVTADTHNWTHASGTDYHYDAAGNMTYDATTGHSYIFDPENRISGANGVTYSYDGDGNRVRKYTDLSAANGTLYWYMTPGIIAESDQAGTLKSEYVFFDGERVARKDFPATTVAYYFSDHLKTASVVTDAAGNVQAESDYYPWGGELQFVANDSNHYKFTGKERDTETGFDYFGARYYSNGLGRWVSADWSATPVPVPYADLGDPQSLNLYGYVRSIPITRADIDGHDGPGLKEIVEVTTADWALISAAGAGTAGATPLALAAPSAGGMVLAVAGPKLQALDNMGCLCPDNTMYMWSGHEGQAQTQDGNSQETEHTPDPAPASGGAMKGGGNIQENKVKGDAYRDEVADALKSSGKDVKTEVTKKTPFGPRRMDIEVKHNGKASGVETKTGNSRYRPSQRAKDNYLRKHGYPVNLVRKPKDKT